MVPFHIFESPGLRDNPHVTLLATDKGGHCSFIGWRSAATEAFQDMDRYWAENRLLQFLLALEKVHTAAA